MCSEQIKLPTGYSTFDEIRTEGFLYIDKTDYINSLISNNEFKYWFLARPRRFGKTMFVDTLEHLFRGNSELFRGLNIYSKGYDFQPAPVIRLNMARSASDIDELKRSIVSHLTRVATELGLTIKSQIPAEAMEWLIMDLSAKNEGRRVVVLIDEYDKPILDHIDKPELAKEIRETLRNFYISLKNSEKFLRFVFVTGISKLAKTAIHSALNNLKDITHWPMFAGICGYTLKEFEDNFSPLFDDFLFVLSKIDGLNKIKDKKILFNSILSKYNGYSWDGKTKILNPYSINNCFSDKMLGNYWIDSGPPLFLEHCISNNPTAFLPGNWEKLSAKIIDKTEIGDLRPVSVLFQTGYLTISEITVTADEIVGSDGSISFNVKTFYSLKIPNNEVLESYKIDLFNNLFPLLIDNGERDICRSQLINAIISKDAVKLAEILHCQLARIAYPEPAEFQKQWGYALKLGEFLFHTVFQTFFDGLKLMVISEAMSSEGRSDIDIILPNNQFAVVEIKFIPAAEDNKGTKKTKKSPLTADILQIMEKKALEALNQLADTLQAEKYQNKGRVISVGVVVYGRDRVLVKFG
ncbi:MAG: ATP-binding protein [Deltaproteobacteria bacterium]|jgi:hypothetical protein|nr:ATP-binding protein [Deltaproteobacteria bacterium]